MIGACFYQFLIGQILMQIVVGKKYEVAVNKETPVMTLEWIEVVWKKGQTENIHATDPQFAK